MREAPEGAEPPLLKAGSHQHWREAGSRSRGEFGIYLNFIVVDIMAEASLLGGWGELVE